MNKEDALKQIDGYLFSSKDCLRVALEEVHDGLISKRSAWQKAADNCKACISELEALRTTILTMSPEEYAKSWSKLPRSSDILARNSPRHAY